MPFFPIVSFFMSEFALGRMRHWLVVASISSSVLLLVNVADNVFKSPHVRAYLKHFVASGKMPLSPPFSRWHYSARGCLMFPRPILARRDAWRWSTFLACSIFSAPTWFAWLRARFIRIHNQWRMTTSNRRSGSGNRALAMWTCRRIIVDGRTRWRSRAP